MTLPDLSASEFQPMLPALVMALGACVLLLTEVYQSTVQGSRGYQSWLSVLFAAAAGITAVQGAFEPSRTVFLGFGVMDPFSAAVSAVVALGVGLAALLSAGFLQHRNAERGEYYALLLFAGAGMSLLAVSNEFITLFINLEVMSVATYALTAYLRRGPRPAEAGFKYFILGAFSAAILLYGAALLYGATGTTKLSELAEALPGALRDRPQLTYLGAALVAVGFAFKVAAVPFHMWTPDVYEGAPTPVTGLMSAGVKAAAFAAFVRVFLPFALVADPRLAMGLFGGLALLTMVFGNLMALPQRNVKRMLAYSSIAHAGYLLLGVAALFVRPGEGASGVMSSRPLVDGVMGEAMLRADALKGILFYLLAYTVTSLGAFGVLSALERREDEPRGTAWDLERFSGLAERRPGWAVAMAAMMLSLGGIPPTVGFMGKLLIFRSAVDAGLLGLAVVGVLSSAVGVYYYLRVVVFMFMRPSQEGAVTPARVWSTDLALVLSTAAVVLLGVLPGPVSSWLGRAGVLFGQ